MGFGTAWDKASGQAFENASSANAYYPCTVSADDPSCQATPKLSGFTLGFGGVVMFNKKFGGGMEYQVQPTLSNYGPFQYRQSFYDFNGVYEPISNKRYSLQIQGGIGGARTSLSVGNATAGCVAGVTCVSGSSEIGSYGHFQTHVGIGLQVYVTQHVFIRPQFDYRYVPNLTQQFGSNAVPSATVWVGYSMGHDK
jgi:hypothetical protein